MFFCTAFAFILIMMSVPRSRLYSRTYLIGLICRTWALYLLFVLRFLPRSMPYYCSFLDVLLDVKESGAVQAS